ncbi:MAG: hypothetical protein ACYS21_18410 [Planctomycetota bacterium]
MLIYKDSEVFEVNGLFALFLQVVEIELRPEPPIAGAVGEVQIVCVADNPGEAAFYGAVMVVDGAVLRTNTRLDGQRLSNFAGRTLPSWAAGQGLCKSRD